MFSNEAVTVAEAAVDAFDTGMDFAIAFAPVKDTLFAPVWEAAWKEKEAEYEREFMNWLSETEAADFAYRQSELGIAV